MSDSFLLKRGVVLCLVLALGFAGVGVKDARADDVAGGVPGAVLLSVGFGLKNFGEEKFVNLGGTGVLGIVEFFGSDVWLSGGLYTNLTFMGDVINKDPEPDPNAPPPTNISDAPSEGWAIAPGLALGLTIGAIPSLDIHVLGTVGGSFALLSRFQIHDGVRVRTASMRGRVGYDYGAMVAVAYTGSNPWWRGFTFGVEGAMHENTFDRWHLGFVLGFSF